MGNSCGMAGAASTGRLNVIVVLSHEELNWPDKSHVLKLGQQEKEDKRDWNKPEGVKLDDTRSMLKTVSAEARVRPSVMAGWSML